jgi:hypothetical protein
MTDIRSASPVLEVPEATPARQARSERAPENRWRRELPRPTGVEAQRKARRGDMRVAIRSQIGGMRLERVCLVLGGAPFAPAGTLLLGPGETSAPVQISSRWAGARGAIYFELSGAGRKIALVTDELFEVDPRASVVVSIDDATRAHNAPIEVEGAVARLARLRLPGGRRR